MLRTALAATAVLLLAVPAAARQDGSTGTEDRANSQTLIGCVQGGDDGRTFTLTESADRTRTWLLVAGEDVDLTDHAGHEVEVTGEPAPAEGDEPRTPAADTPQSDVRMSEDAAGPKLTVKTVRTIARSCG